MLGTPIRWTGQDTGVSPPEGGRGGLGPRGGRHGLNLVLSLLLSSPPVVVMTEPMPGLVSEWVILAGPPGGGAQVAVGLVGLPHPRSLCGLRTVPEALPAWEAALPGVSSSLLGLPEASGSEAEPEQDPWADQITLFLAGSKAGSQDHATREWNRVPKTPRVTPVGGGGRLPEGPCPLLTRLCVCPVLSPPAAPCTSPAGSRVEGAGPGVAPGGTFSRVAQVRPGPEGASPPERREAWGRGSQRG